MGSEPAYLEQKILAALCAASLPPGERLGAVRMLSMYAWREPEHQTVFQAIQRLSSARQASWREELPAQATRMGFPDVDWSRYFGAPDQHGPAVKEMIARLLESAPEDG